MPTQKNAVHIPAARVILICNLVLQQCASTGQHNTRTNTECDRNIHLCVDTLCLHRATQSSDKCDLNCSHHCSSLL